MIDDHALRYREAAEDALEQLDWCIGYLHGIGKRRITRQLARNRTYIRRNLMRERPNPCRPKAQARQGGDARMTSESRSAPVTTRSRVVDPVGEFVLEAQPDGDAVTVALAGEFDLAMADPIRKALTRAMRKPRERLILDLSDVTFIDSSGVHIILDAYQVCRDGGPRLTIRPGPPCVQQVFEVTNLLSYLPFEISA